jgi:hypothetical protein
MTNDQAADLVAQTAAWGAGAAAVGSLSANPKLSITAAGAGAAAFLAAKKVLTDDENNGSSKLAVAGDIVEMLGDGRMTLSAILNTAAIATAAKKPSLSARLKVSAAIADVAGDILTGMGLEIKAQEANPTLNSAQLLSPVSAISSRSRRRTLR